MNPPDSRTLFRASRLRALSPRGLCRSLAIALVREISHDLFVTVLRFVTSVCEWVASAAARMARPKSRASGEMTLLKVEVRMRD